MYEFKSSYMTLIWWSLELIGADYAGVDLAIRYAQGLDPRNYTNFNAVSTAITAVERGKSIAEQDLVDEMAADIVEAILSLQRIEPATTPTPTPSPGSTITPTPTPYKNTTSNGITLEQLQELLNKNKATPTPSVPKLGLPKTGDQLSRWGALLLVLALPAVIYCFQSRKQKRSK